MVVLELLVATVSIDVGGRVAVGVLYAFAWSVFDQIRTTDHYHASFAN